MSCLSSRPSTVRVGGTDDACGDHSGGFVAGGDYAPTLIVRPLIRGVFATLSTNSGGRSTPRFKA